MFFKKRRYRVRTINRAQISYVEDDRMMLISVEPAGNGIIVYTNSIQNWEPPNEDIPVTEEDRERILQNVKSGLAPSWAFWMKVHLYPDDDIQETTLC